MVRLGPVRLVVEHGMDLGNDLAVEEVARLGVVSGKSDPGSGNGRGRF